MKKGFTLIELLAVIVILAIIALIATPIVLSIINDSKESAVIRSGEFYVNAVENKIMQENMRLGGSFNPEKCIIGTDGNANCDGTPLKIEINGEKPTGGNITFDKGKVTSVNLTFGDKNVSMNQKGELVLGETNEKTFDEICTYLDNGVAEKTAGAKYSCKVDPNKEPYNFYVLTTPSSTDTSVNLIMDRNLGDKVVWVSQKDYTTAGGSVSDFDGSLDGESDFPSTGNNNLGPITALEYLNSQTSEWKNIAPITYYTYLNNENGTSYTYGYQKLIVTNGIGVLTSQDGTKNTTVLGTMRARLLTDDEYSLLKNANSNKTPTWLYDNLSSSNTIEKPNGYWLLTTASSTYIGAISMNYHSDTTSFSVDLDTYNGIRPVINLKI